MLAFLEIWQESIGEDNKLTRDEVTKDKYTSNKGKDQYDSMYYWPIWFRNAVNTLILGCDMMFENEMNAQTDSTTILTDYIHHVA